MKDFVNKNCFITGAASGIGHSFAIALAREGMNLYITDINMEELDDVKKEIEKIGVKVYAEKCDVSNFRDFENAANNFHKKLGELDLLINNAGISIGGNVTVLELEDWKKVLDVNLWSIIHSLKVFLPRMIERRSGHIVNISSGAGIIGSSEPLPYIASKFAVVGISEGLFGRLKNLGINVSVIVPSYIRTNIFNNAQMKFPQKLIEDEGEDKLTEIIKERLDDMASKAMLPDRAVKRYIVGIKKDQLYIFDIKGTLSALALKGKPQEYENFLVNFNENFYNSTRELYLKHGIKIDDYI
ncbi:MAG: SDR family NAD(P)-dependent oxidoreductase [Promethearchaeota archaeon]